MLQMRRQRFRESCYSSLALSQVPWTNIFTLHCESNSASISWDSCSMYSGSHLQCPTLQGHYLHYGGRIDCGSMSPNGPAWPSGNLSRIMTTGVRWNHLSHWRVTTKPRIKDPLVLSAFLFVHTVGNHLRAFKYVLEHCPTAHGAKRGYLWVQATISKMLLRTTMIRVDTWHHTRMNHLGLEGLCLGTCVSGWNNSGPKGTLSSAQGFVLHSDIGTDEANWSQFFKCFLCVSALDTTDKTTVISTHVESTLKWAYVGLIEEIQRNSPPQIARWLGGKLWLLEKHVWPCALNPGSATCDMALSKCPYLSMPHFLLLKIDRITDRATWDSKIHVSSANILNTIETKISTKHLQSEFKST